MAVEILTKEDLILFKEELFSELKKLLGNNNHAKYLQTPEVKKFLGISSGTLQHLRITGQLPYTKVGGKIFYEMAEIQKMIEQNKKKQN